MNISVQDLSIDTIIQVISILGAVASFIIVQSIEKKKERKLANREIYQQLEFASIDLFRFEAENIDLIRPIWEEDTEIPPHGTAEYNVVMNYVCQMLNLFEMAMKFRKDKEFQAEVFGTWVAWFELLSNAPGFPAIWEDVRLDYLPELREIMDGGILIARNEEDEDAMERKFYAFVSEVIGCKIISDVKENEFTQRVEDLRKSYEEKKAGEKLPEQEGLEFKWINDKKEAAALAAFFIEQVKPDYISHSEIQEGRAFNEHEWSANLPELLETEFTEATQTVLFEKLDLAGVYLEKQLLGFALVEFSQSPQGKYATLSDIVVSAKHRNQKVAEKLFLWVLPQLQEQGITQLFAESNQENSVAHAFLEKVGFSQISRVFRMEL